MNAPLAHPVIPVAVERRETAPAAPVTAPAPIIHVDLDTLDLTKFQGVTQKSSFGAWR